MPGVSLGITLPTVGVTVSPTWATNLNTAIQTLIDDIEPQIVASEININADLSFGTNEATNIGAMELEQKTASITGSANAGKIYNVSGDLYWTNEDGTAIQLTAGNAINVTATGGFGGSYVGNGSAVYNTGSPGTFVFTKSSNGVPAKMDCGDILLRETLASTNAVTLKSPATLASNYSVLFPTAAPASTVPVQMASTGQLSASATLAADLTLSGDNTYSGTNIFNSGLQVSATGGKDDVLDAFESSTFTPTLYIGGSLQSTYTLQQGYYVRVGSWIIATVAIEATSIDAASADNVTVRALPGTVDFTSMQQWVGSVSHFAGGSQTWAATDFVGVTYIDGATDQVFVVTNGGGATSAWTCDTTLDLYFTIAYRTS